MSQPTLLLCMYFHQLRTHHAIGVYRPPLKETGGISDVFVNFSCRLEPYYSHFFGGTCVWFWNNNISPTCNNFLL